MGNNFKKFNAKFGVLSFSFKSKLLKIKLIKKINYFSVVFKQLKFNGVSGIKLKLFFSFIFLIDGDLFVVKFCCCGNNAAILAAFKIA